jgi:hypothetical protein
MSKIIEIGVRSYELSPFYRRVVCDRTRDRTRPVNTCASGQRVRSVFLTGESDRTLKRVRSVMTGRVRSLRELTGTSLFAVSLRPARPVPLVTCASGQYKFIRTKTSRWSTLLTCVSSQFDRRVRSTRNLPSEGTNGSILLWSYK